MLQDLLPAEIASSRKPGPAPMRRGGSPPKSAALDATGVPHAQQAALQPCSVDGVPDNVVDAWFCEADKDGDGRVADSEARTFFLTSGLAPADLSKIWQLVKSPEVIGREGKGLTRHRFTQVLRLIALAQSDFPFTPENTAAALHATSWVALHGAPLPPPRIGTAAQQAAAAAVAAQQAQQAPLQQQQQVLQEQPQQAAPPQDVPPAAPRAVGAGNPFNDSGDLLGLAVEGAVPAPLPPPATDIASTTTAVPLLSTADNDDDLFGLKALHKRAASHGAATTSTDEVAAPQDAACATTADTKSVQRRFSRSLGVSSHSGSTRGSMRVHTAPLEPPVAFEARLPPLQPKVSAKLTMLAAANGSLFAGPAVGGGLLQWGRAEGNMRRPTDVQEEAKRGGKPKPNGLARLMSDMMVTHVVERDTPTEDPDAAPAVELAATDKQRTTACLLVDEAAGLLWVADKEGWVCAYSTTGAPSMPLNTAHRVHMFQACRVGHVTAMCRTPQGELWTGSSRGNVRVWELGPPALLAEQPSPPRCRELRKGYGERAHGGPVLRLACPADGQLVWSASPKRVLLWDAACGAFLGALQRTAPRLVPTTSSGELPAGNGDREREALRYKVDGTKGLETDPLTGHILARPPSSEWARWASEQENWAAQTDNNINELMERVSIGGSRVVQGAGKAVKLLGKLARGLGGAPAAAEAPRPAGASAASLAGRQLSSSLGSGPLAMAAAGAAADDEAAGAAPEVSVSGIIDLLVPPDGSVWVAHKCGTVDRYTSAGRRLGTSECGASLTAAACVGQRVWLGFSDGMLSVRAADGAALKVWQAHETAVLSIVQAGSRVYSLAADGSIKGWSSAVPHPADLQALISWDEEARGTYRRESLRLLCVTWNVGESKPEPGSPFFRWVHEAAFDAQLAVVGLQEIEMGSSSVALAAAKDAFSQKMQERGNTNAKFWSQGVLSALGGERHWHQVGLRQLSGMLILVYARNHLRDSIGEVTTASVACGVLGVGGNKGAVAVEFSLHRRRLAVLCSHFAAHQGAVEARNANYATICRQLTFSRRAWYADDSEGGPAGGAAGAPNAAAVQAQQGQLASSTRLKPYAVATAVEEAMGGDDADSDAESTAGGMDVAAVNAAAAAAAAAAAEGGPGAIGEGMRGAHMLVWLGDFNYRIDGPYEAVKEHAIRNELGVLAELVGARLAAGRACERPRRPACGALCRGAAWLTACSRCGCSAGAAEATPFQS
ncbi:hypothetical protein ABPG77_007469 [Micractinium sp. CCAP 211/92]